MPSIKPKIVTYTTETVIKKLEIIAKKEDRSMSKEVEHLIKKYIEEYEEKNGIIEF